MTALLQVRSVGMQFQGLAALSDVTFDVPGRQIRGLIGPNGAGKTTMFNCITGFYRPTSGSIVLDGVALEGRPSHEISSLGVSRTFQNIRLFSSMTAIENVLAVYRHDDRRAASVRTPASTRIGEALRSLPGAPAAAAMAIREIAGAIIRPPSTTAREQTAVIDCLRLLHLVGLRNKENVVARNLPYGDQRRLELARALGTRPKVLLLDEPTAGMNPQEALSMVGLIRRIRDELGVTVILIEHQMRVVMGVCEYITVLDYGRSIAEGTPAEVQKDPRVIEAYLGRRAQQEGARGAP